MKLSYCYNAIPHYASLPLAASGGWHLSCSYSHINFRWQALLPRAGSILLKIWRAIPWMDCFVDRRKNWKESESKSWSVSSPRCSREAGGSELLDEGGPGPRGGGREISPRSPHWRLWTGCTRCGLRWRKESGKSIEATHSNTVVIKSGPCL